jgi:hypothetical protein
VALSVFFLATSALADGQEWSSSGARTMPADRIELGAFSSWKWGVTEHVEIAAQPLLFFLLPNAALKAQFAYGSTRSFDYYFATRHRLSIPSGLLHVLSAEGSGGLLPADTDVPFTLQSENVVLGTLVFGSHELTALGGFAFSMHESTDIPMVEFPFLYSYLAPTYAPFVGVLGAGVEGQAVGPLHYRVAHRMSLWQPRPELAWPEGPAPLVLSQETRLGADLRLGRHQISLGAAIAVARYPIGYRLHWTPTLDYRFALAR